MDRASRGRQRPGPVSAPGPGRCAVLTAVLEKQGLRPTRRGGHLAVYEATRAQLDPPMGQVLRPFDRLRRQRHDVEYPSTDAPQISADDIREDAAKARAIVDLSERVLGQMPPF